MNTKVALVDGGQVRAVCGRPFELQRDPDALVPLLHALARDVGAEPPMLHALTMTAELSQMFRTKRDGVTFVVNALETAFGSSRVRVYAADGRFLSPEEARRQPLAVAAANWAATAREVAVHHADVLLIDVGTTTTDIIPIVGGTLVATGWTDPERLAAGELVYTGALRTPVEAIVTHAPYAGGMAGVSAEAFALVGDVHVWLGALSPDDYTVPTPDGRPVTRELCGERLARVICADRDLLDEDGVTRLAEFVAAAQAARIAAAIGRVATRHPSLRTAVVAGVGAFIAQAAARAAGLGVLDLASDVGSAAARCAPAAAVALLLDRESARA